jgi:hypothetical protein
MRSAAASAHFDHRSNFSAEIEVASWARTALTASISADIHRSSQRCGFIKQAIDPCLFNSLSMFLLFAFRFAIRDCEHSLQAAPCALRATQTGGTQLSR